ncbi:MAG: Two-component system sensor histidine kinase [uncultured Pseudonocardia sp.]|uniref:Two-component system sensor histidine kinase n=1 Tax=uncultured Pseudonocardia sp. TaxID=211455 RepID=A0A6J4P1L5_9PSEU|nr:MAG: Two-component system sensor histidine kinase [uncultured Pseudonocardia sp.]
MGVARADDGRLERVDERMDSFFARYGVVVSLGVGLALAPILPVPATVAYWGTTVALAAALLLWSYAFVIRHPGRAEVRAGPVYIAGYAVLLALLVHQNPFFAFASPVGYAHSYAFLRGRWRLVGMAAIAVSVAYSQLGGRFLGEVTPALVVGLVLLTALNAGVAGGFTYMHALTSEQSHRRKQIIAELDAALAENAALHARLVAQAREAGVLDERARMAREIHDTLAQGLTGIVTQLEAAASDDPEVRRRHVDTARALARESLSEARRSVEALAPGRLADARLPEAIRSMAEDWSGTAGVAVHVDVTGEPVPLLPEIEVTLFRVAQEALANVRKHARATRAGLTLSYMDDVVVLDVRDDGVGLGPHRTPGFGLAAMEQRVRRVSGTLVVEGGDVDSGDGAAVNATVPALPAAVSTGPGEGP